MIKLSHACVNTNKVLQVHIWKEGDRMVTGWFFCGKYHHTHKLSIGETC